MNKNRMNFLDPLSSRELGTLLANNHYALQPEAVVIRETVEVPVVIPEGPAAEMTPFEEYTISPEKHEYWNTNFNFDIVKGHRNNIYDVYLIRDIQGSKKEEWWINKMGVSMHWLSLKRLDQRAVTDWRHLQQIKTELVGPENEAFQLHPAESRVRDTANQFHLLVFADPWPVGIPIGWTLRAGDDDQEMCKATGSRQRPLGKIIAGKVSGVICRECGNTLPPHSQKRHLDENDPIHACPHKEKI